MKVIGITGGIGAGKTTVLNILKENYNSYVILADDVARNTMKKGETGYNKVLDIFGEEILDSDGEIDRAHLSTIVFNNKNKLMVLNSIIHPLTKKIILETINELKCQGKYDYIFVEAALLIEDHYEIICDELWYIYADEATRRSRLKQSRSYSDEKIDEIFASQSSEAVFREHCQQVINNNQDENYVKHQLQKLLG